MNIFVTSYNYSVDLSAFSVLVVCVTNIKHGKHSSYNLGSVINAAAAAAAATATTMPDDDDDDDDEEEVEDDDNKNNNNKFEIF